MVQRKLEGRENDSRAPGTRTIGMCSFDGRSQELLTPLLSCSLNWRGGSSDWFRLVYSSGTRNHGTRIHHMNVPSGIQTKAHAIRDAFPINSLCRANTSPLNHAIIHHLREYESLKLWTALQRRNRPCHRRRIICQRRNAHDTLNSTKKGSTWD